MTQHEFNILSEKYLRGECSPEEVALLERWTELHFQAQEKKLLFEDEQQLEHIGARLWARVSESAALPGRRRIGDFFRQRGWQVAAACLIGALSFWLFLQPERTNETVVARADSLTEAASGQSKVTLPDGSVVTLAEGAAIEAATDFGIHTRTVYLRGEAFFDIRRNPEQPFVVHSGDLVTEVLGTSFRIRPRQQEKTIEVSVVTGKVSVYSADPAPHKKKNGVIITPNQRVLYHTELKTLRQDLVDQPKPVQKVVAPSDFEFEETAVAKVLALLHKTYGIEIVLSNPALNQCVFTGDLNGLDMYRQLDFVCEVINATYEIRGTTIYISGQGCSPG